MNTHLNFKSIIYKPLLALSLVAVLASCSSTSDGDKQAQLDALRKQHADLSKEIQKLEADIAKENPEAAASKLKVKEVEVKELAPRKFEHYLKTQGRIEAEDNIMVSAKSAGVVTNVFVNEGDQVSKGQVLAQIDNGVMVRNIEAMKSQLELATSVYERQEKLWQQKIGTEVQYLQAKTNKEGLERQLEALQEQNGMTRITSPISGTVDQVSIKVGENIAPGMPAVRVVNMGDLKLKASVSEAYVTNIKKGDKVMVTIPDVNKEVEAKVTFVGKTIDQLSRAFDVEVKLPSQKDLRPNMTANVKIVFQTEESTIVVPVNIIQEINDEKIIYVAEANGKQTVAKRKVVTVGGVYDNQAKVTGLNAGEKIITVGYQGLNDGQLIKI